MVADRVLIGWSGTVGQHSGRVETTCWLGLLMAHMQVDVTWDTTLLRGGLCCPPRQNLGVCAERFAKPLISLALGTAHANTSIAMGSSLKSLYQRLKSPVGPRQSRQYAALGSDF